MNKTPYLQIGTANVVKIMMYNILCATLCEIADRHKECRMLSATKQRANVTTNGNELSFIQMNKFLILWRHITIRKRFTLFGIDFLFFFF